MLLLGLQLRSPVCLRGTSTTW